MLGGFPQNLHLNVVVLLHSCHLKKVSTPFPASLDALVLLAHSPAGQVISTAYDSKNVPFFGDHL